jgi:hypothetical protein
LDGACGFVEYNVNVILGRGSNRRLLFREAEVGALSVKGAVKFSPWIVDSTRYISKPRQESTKKAKFILGSYT